MDTDTHEGGHEAHGAPGGHSGGFAALAKKQPVLVYGILGGAVIGLFLIMKGKGNGSGNAYAALPALPATWGGGSSGTTPDPVQPVPGPSPQPNYHVPGGREPNPAPPPAPSPHPLPGPNPKGPPDPNPGHGCPPGFHWDGNKCTPDHNGGGGGGGIGQGAGSGGGGTLTNFGGQGGNTLAAPVVTPGDGSMKSDVSGAKGVFAHMQASSQMKVM